MCMYNSLHYYYGSTSFSCVPVTFSSFFIPLTVFPCCSSSRDQRKSLAGLLLHVTCDCVVGEDHDNDDDDNDVSSK